MELHQVFLFSEIIKRYIFSGAAVPLPEVDITQVWSVVRVLPALGSREIEHGHGLLKEDNSERPIADLKEYLSLKL